MKSLLLKFRSNDFLKNSLTLSSGVALAQIIPFLFYPLLGRIFSAEEFGLLATLTSITSILAVLGSGKYESGIIISGNKLEGANLAVLSVVVGFVTMFVSWVLCQFVFIGPLSRWLEEPSLNRWIYICPLSAFFIIVFNVYNEWCVKERYFKSLSVNKMVNSGAIALSKTFLGFVKISSQGLVIGDLVGRGISAAGCMIRAWIKDGQTFAQTTWAEMGRCAVKYKEFPLYTMPGRLLNTIGQSIPVLLIAFYYGKTEVGYFSMAMTLFSVPINIFSTSVSDVYRQRASEEYRQQGNCLASFDRVMKILTICGVAAFMVFEWILPQVTQFILGKQWLVAGRYAQILAPAMVVMFVSNSLSGIFIVTERLKAFFWWQVYFSVTTLLSVWLGPILFDGIERTLILFSALRITAYLASLFMTRRYARGQK